jgi:hypothetical protein
MKLMFFCLLLVLVSSCDIINPQEEVPGFLLVSPFQLTTTPAQGSSSSKITEVWVSVDGEFLGAFPLPARIPVLGSGERRISLQAGIKDNGISSSPDIFPFYTITNTTLNLQPNQTYTIQPGITYLPETRFALIENFEGPQHVFSELRVGGPNQAMQKSTVAPFEGTASGLITLDSTHTIAEIATRPIFRNLNERSPFVYLEMDYKSEVPVLVGLVGYGPNTPLTGRTLYEAGFLPKENWNKIYFNLSQSIFASGLNDFQVVVQAAIPVQNGTLTRNTARIWIDNVKLVHF